MYSPVEPGISSEVRRACSWERHDATRPNGKIALTPIHPSLISSRQCAGLRSPRRPSGSQRSHSEQGALASKHRQMARRSTSEVVPRGFRTGFVQTTGTRIPRMTCGCFTGFGRVAASTSSWAVCPDAPEPQLLQLLAVKLCYAIYGVAL